MELEASDKTIRSEQRDFVEWHRGRVPYVFWAIYTDTPAVRNEVARAGFHLREFLLDSYRRQPHVTLDLCGFPAARPNAPDEFSSSLLRGQLQRLRAASLTDFMISLEMLSSFKSAPYLEIVDAGAVLTKIRACLAEEGGNRLLGNYVPHCTVGLYAADWPSGPVIDCLRSYPATPPLHFVVNRVSLMSYHPADIAGPLTLLGDYWLESGQIDWYPASKVLGLGVLPE